MATLWACITQWADICYPPNYVSANRTNTKVISNPRTMVSSRPTSSKQAKIVLRNLQQLWQSWYCDLVRPSLIREYCMTANMVTSSILAGGHELKYCPFEPGRRLEMTYRAQKIRDLVTIFLATISYLVRNLVTIVKLRIWFSLIF